MAVGLSILLSLMLSLGSTVDNQHAGHSLSMSKNPFKDWESHGAAKLITTNRANSTFDHGKCLFCKVLVSHGLQRIKTTKNVTTLLSIVEKMCVLLRLESSKVCKGGIDIFGKQVSVVLKQVDFSPEDLCYLAFPDQCSVSAMSLPGSRKWKIPLPTARTSPAETCRHEHQQRPKSENALKVLHLTDIHVDLLYNLRGKVKCDQPVCCRSEPPSGGVYRNYTEWSSKAFSIMSEFLPPRAPGKAPEAGVGRWGDYRHCDLPLWTLEHMLATIANGSKKGTPYSGSDLGHIDYIMLTGDLTSHDIWAQSKSGQRSALTNLNSVIRKYFPNTKVFPSPGNHDSYPPNNYPPANEESLKGLSDPWIYEALAEQWKSWLPNEALETVKAGAYYTVVVQPGLRVVSLNTNFCYTENWWIYMSSEDPAGMLMWFVKVLTEAENAGEKVHVIGHVPPGRSPDCLESWSENYYRILQRFKCTITGQFFGHTHFDEMQLFYENEKPIAVAYIAPSATPYVDMNPAFRVYDIHGLGSNPSWSVMNHYTYFLDLEEANQSGVARWKLEYDALRAYNLSSLAPKDWAGLISNWKAYLEDKSGNPPLSLLRYMTFYSRGRFDRGGQKEPEQYRHRRDTSIPCEHMECALKVLCNVIKNSSWKMCSV